MGGWGFILYSDSGSTIYSIKAGNNQTYGYVNFDEFNNYKQVTIDADFVDTDLTDFPVKIHDNTGDLAYIQSDGSDISFWDSSNTTQYNHEIEYYNSTSGELITWVNVTDVSSSVDTTVWMYYNDSDGDYTVGHNPTLVWDSDFVVVYHMNDNDGGLTDSTTYGNDATENITNPPDADDYNQTGKIGYAVRYQGTGDSTQDGEHHHIPDIMTNAEWETGFTISIWVNLSNLDNYRTFVDFQKSSSTLLRMQDATYNSSFMTYDDASQFEWLDNIDMATDTWYHFSGSYNGSNDEKELI